MSADSSIHLPFSQPCSYHSRRTTLSTQSSMLNVRERDRFSSVLPQRSSSSSFPSCKSTVSWMSQGREEEEGEGRKGKRKEGPQGKEGSQRRGLHLHSHQHHNPRYNCSALAPYNLSSCRVRVLCSTSALL